MTEHDKAVLSICRNFLKKGEKEIEIGQKVVSRKRIVTQLKREFPNRRISVAK